MTVSVLQAFDILINDALRGYQKEWIDDILNSRHVAILASRQIGKSYTLALVSFMLAYLENQKVLIISENLEKAKNIIDETAEHIQLVEKVCKKKIIKSKNAQQIVLNSANQKQIKITARPGSPQALQGYTGSVFIDELSITRYDHEELLIQAMSVASSNSEFKVVICTNADRKNSFVHNFFQPSSDEWKEKTKKWKTHDVDIFRAYSVNSPSELPEQIRDIYTTTRGNKLWQRFYLNSFLEGNGERYDMDNVPIISNEFQIENKYVIMGIDPGFKINPTGIIVIEMDTKSKKINVLNSTNLYRKTSTEQMSTIKEFIKKYKPNKISIDAGTAGMTMADDLYALYPHSVIKKNVTNKFYDETSEKLDYLLCSGSIFLKDKKLQKEINMIELSGTTIHLPTSKPYPLPHPDAVDHCDLYVALCLCLDAIPPVSSPSRFRIKQFN